VVKPLAYDNSRVQPTATTSWLRVA